MKNVYKILGIIAIGAIIVVGLGACITISTPPEPTEEELALRETLRNATWSVERLDNPPSLTGFEKISKLGYKAEEWVIKEEAGYINDHAGDSESDAGKTMTIRINGINTERKLLGMDANTWYMLTAPEFPGITYYYFRENKGGSMSTINIYKGQ